MAVFIGIFLVLYMHYICCMPAINIENDTIGDTKIIDGIEYFNVGTLDNKDNWVELGSGVVQYYVNIYEESEGYQVVIEEEMNDKALKSIECYDFVEAQRTYEFAKRFY